LSIGTHVRRQHPSSAGGKTFTKSFIFVFKSVIGCSKAADMIFPRKAAEAVSRLLSCDNAVRKILFSISLLSNPFRKSPRCLKQRGFFCVEL
jgi:hypothetical protein